MNPPAIINSRNDIVEVPESVINALRADQPPIDSNKVARYHEDTKALVVEWIRTTGITNKVALATLKTTITDRKSLSSATLGLWTSAEGVNVKKKNSSSATSSDIDRKDYERLKKMEEEFLAFKHQMLVNQLDSEAAMAKKSLPQYLWSKISKDDSKRLIDLLLPYYKEHHIKA